MGTLDHQKQQIVVLEAECNLLRNMVLNLSKGAQSGASNQRMSVNSAPRELKEEDNVHQLAEDIEIVKQDYVPSNVGLEEAVSHHVFH